MGDSDSHNGPEDNPKDDSEVYSALDLLEGFDYYQKIVYRHLRDQLTKISVGELVEIRRKRPEDCYESKLEQGLLDFADDDKRKPHLTTEDIASLAASLELDYDIYSNLFLSQIEIPESQIDYWAKETLRYSHDKQLSETLAIEQYVLIKAQQESDDIIESIKRLNAKKEDEGSAKENPV